MSSHTHGRKAAAFCLNYGMDAETAARRWADTWSRAWPQRDVEAIAALYADTAVYRSPAFRQPYPGLAGVRRSGENLPAEETASRKGAALANRSAERLSCNSRRLWLDRWAGIWSRSHKRAYSALLLSQDSHTANGPGSIAGKCKRNSPRRRGVAPGQGRPQEPCAALSPRRKRRSRHPPRATTVAPVTYREKRSHRRATATSAMYTPSTIGGVSALMLRLRRENDRHTH